jgi:predicted nuclease of predicted toxin-antitoxin system
VKLLLDENVSDRIVQHIVDLFPGSAHIKTCGLKEADDSVVWEWAKQHGFAITSKDIDFHQKAVAFGHPPKFIWLRVGNCPSTGLGCSDSHWNIPACPHSIAATLYLWSR